MWGEQVSVLNNALWIGDCSLHIYKAASDGQLPGVFPFCSYAPLFQRLPSEGIWSICSGYYVCYFSWDFSFPYEVRSNSGFCVCGHWIPPRRGNCLSSDVQVSFTCLPECHTTRVTPHCGLSVAAFTWDSESLLRCGPIRPVTYMSLAALPVFKGSGFSCPFLGWYRICGHNLWTHWLVFRSNNHLLSSCSSHLLPVGLGNTVTRLHSLLDLATCYLQDYINVLEMQF